MYKLLLILLIFLIIIQFHRKRESFKWTKLLKKRGDNHNCGERCMGHSSCIGFSDDKKDCYHLYNNMISTEILNTHTLTHRLISSAGHTQNDTHRIWIMWNDILSLTLTLRRRRRRLITYTFDPSEDLEFSFDHLFVALSITQTKLCIVWDQKPFNIIVCIL